jgi:peroxiredoxin Q/BCP
MSTMPAAGEPAPDFALPDENGVIHRLSDQRGRWTIVYFYPKDDTPGCTVEACAFRDANDALLAAGAVVWGISPDDARSHGRFREKFRLTFPLLSDEDHATAEAYGAWVEKTRYGKTYMGIQRSTFLVAPDGRVAHAWHRVTADGHAEDVMATLEAARAAG